MLKFRFRKQILRRRSNSCPHLERERNEDDIGFEHNAEPIRQTATQDETASVESGSETESESVPRWERLKFQRSIRRVKKKEKEQQDNSEKNLLSMDDYYGKLALLKEWLSEECRKDLNKISSPKLKSHFKAFIKLWNKRKLPAKYYRSCCVDTVEASSNPDDPSSSIPSTPFNFGGLSHLPSYHRFPPVDEPDTPWKSLFGSPRRFLPPRSLSDDTQSPFSTFGKSTDDSESPQSFLSFQTLHNRNRVKENGIKPSDRHDNQVTKASGGTSPSKFATISKAMPAFTMLKPSAGPFTPRLHPVLSPTCPLTPDKAKTPPNRFLFGPSKNTLVEGRQSPAYICPRDTILYESPEYSQIGEVFEITNEPNYCTISPMYRPEGSFITSSVGQKPKPNLNRRRSKSMEDIYAVPSRLRSLHQDVFSPAFPEEEMCEAPPVPDKKFDRQMSNLTSKDDRFSSLSVADQQTMVTSINVAFTAKVDNYDTIASAQTQGHVGVLPVCQSPESHHQVESTAHLLSPFIHVQHSPQKLGSKRRSQDKEHFQEEIQESPKKVKPANNLLASPASIPSILTGSLGPTTRAPAFPEDPKMAAKNETRLSILQIKKLDSSPTFPRRRVKRRSSSLCVTPGKGLTFGHKTPTYAKSSPRRVSFAKDVKDFEGKGTPRRRSVGRQTTRGKDETIMNDVRRQSQDRAEFESFWSNHSPIRDKNSSPKDGSPGKVWSPPKWLSPTKHQPKVLSVQSPDGKASPGKQRIISPSKKGPTSSEESFSKSSHSSQLEEQRGKREGFSIKLSPSKIVSRLVRNISSSSLLKEKEENANISPKSKSNNVKEIVREKNANPPRSILKNKDQCRSFSQMPSSAIDNARNQGETKDRSQALPVRQLGRRALGPPSPRGKGHAGACHSETGSFHGASESSYKQTELINKPMSFDLRMRNDFFKSFGSKSDQITNENIRAGQTYSETNRCLNNPEDLDFRSYQIIPNAGAGSGSSGNLNSRLQENRRENREITDNVFDKASVRRHLFNAEVDSEISQNTFKPQINSSMNSVGQNSFGKGSFVHAMPHPHSSLQEEQAVSHKCFKTPLRAEETIPDYPENTKGSNEQERHYSSWNISDREVNDRLSNLRAEETVSDYPENTKGNNEQERHYSSWNISDREVNDRLSNHLNDKSKVSNENLYPKQMEPKHKGNFFESPNLSSRIYGTSEKYDTSNVLNPPQNEEAESKEECKLSRFESMKASPTIIENDSWITSRRKSSVRRTKRSTPSLHESFNSPSNINVIEETGTSDENVTHNSNGSNPVDVLFPINCQNANSTFENISSFGSNENPSDCSSKADSSNSLRNDASEVEILSRCKEESSSAGDVNPFPCLVIDYTDGRDSNNESQSSNSAPSDESSSLVTPSSKGFEEVKIILNDKAARAAAYVNAKHQTDTQDAYGKNDSDKENEKAKDALTVRRSNKYPKPKPKPAVRPKPSIRSVNPLTFQGKLNVVSAAINSRPTVRKRSSLVKTESVLASRSSASFKVSRPSSSSINSCKKPIPPVLKTETNSSPSQRSGPPKTRRRSSLTPKKRRSLSNGATDVDHPHVSSFAQRRKFFQQIVESSPAPASMGQARQRPPVRPKPRLSKIGCSTKAPSHGP